MVGVFVLLFIALPVLGLFIFYAGVEIALWSLLGLGVLPVALFAVLWVVSRAWDGLFSQEPPRAICEDCGQIIRVLELEVGLRHGWQAGPYPSYCAGRLRRLGSRGALAPSQPPSATLPRSQGKSPADAACTWLEDRVIAGVAAIRAKWTARRPPRLARCARCLATVQAPEPGGARRLELLRHGKETAAVSVGIAVSYPERYCGGTLHRLGRHERRALRDGRAA